MAHSNENTHGRDSNPDPITGAPGAHPVGVGIGAAGGGATGAAIGTAVAGPIGTAVGAVIGAVAGGLAGKGAAEAVDPTGEDAYWREHHTKQPFVKKDHSYDDYAPAYRTGYEGFGKYGSRFEDAEPKLREHYETMHSTSTGVGSPASSTAAKAKLGWEEAKHAAKAAWHRVETGDAVRVPITEEQVKVGKREVEEGAVRLRKVVHTETVNQPVELKREEVVVERVAAGTPGAVPENAFQEGTIEVPLKREEAVVEKTAHVTGEVRLKKNVAHDTQNVHETVRKEEVRVENEGNARIETDRPSR
jgi:uncharacterized protein (TIGR02271 family)